MNEKSFFPSMSVSMEKNERKIIFSFYERFYGEKRTQFNISSIRVSTEKNEQKSIFPSIRVSMEKMNEKCFFLLLRLSMEKKTKN